MRKKTSLTIVERAIVEVPGFEMVLKKLTQQVTLRGQSKSTLNNYIRRIALYFERLPELIDEEEINEYLTPLTLDPKPLVLNLFCIRGDRIFRCILICIDWYLLPGMT